MKRLARLMLITFVLAHAQPARSAGVPDFNKVIQQSMPYMEQRQFDRAAAILKRGYDEFVKAGRADDIGALELRHNLAAAYYFSGKLEKAIFEFDGVRRIRERKLGLHHEHTRGAYQNLVRIFLDKKDFKKAKELLLSFADKTEAEAKSNHPDLVWALEWLKDIQQDEGRYDEAVSTSAKLRAAFLKVNGDKSDPRYLQYTLNASALYGVLGQLDKSMEVLESAVAEAAISKANTEVLSRHRLNISSIKIAQNDYDAALNALQVGLREVAKVDAIASTPAAELMSAVGAIYVDREEMRSAETYVDRAIEIFTTSVKESGKLPQENPAFVRSYSLLGAVLASQNQKDASLAALEFSFNQYRALINEPDRDWRLIGLRYAKALVQFGFLNEADKIIAAMLKYALPGSAQADGGGSIPALVQACALLRAKGKPNEALSRCLQAEKILASSPGALRPDKLTLAGELAVTYQQKKDIVGAKESTLSVLAEIPLAPKTARTFRNLYKPTLAVVLDALPKDQPLNGQDFAAADLVFRSLQVLRHGAGDEKAERLAYLRQVLNGTALHDALRREYLASRLDRANDRLLKFALSSDDFQKGNAEIRSALISEVRTVQSEMAAIASRGDGAAKSAEQKRSDAVSFAQLQGGLAESDAVIFYQVFADRSFAFVIRRASVVVKVISLTKEQLKEEIAGVRPRSGGSLLAPKDRSDDLLKGFDIKAAQSLYASIWPETAVKGAKAVFIIPDGPISALSFPTLLTGPAKKPSTAEEIRALPWLLKAGQVLAAVPNPGVLLDQKRLARSSEPFFVGIGDPVPPKCGGALSPLTKSATSDAIDPNSLCEILRLADAEDEVRKIANSFPADRREVRLGADATVARLREMNDAGILSRATLLLFATHGLAPGELDQMSDYMRLFATDSVGIPAVGRSVEEFMRNNTKMSEAEIKKYRGALSYTIFSRDVPDIRFRFPPGLVLSSDPSGALGDSTKDGFLSSAEIGLLELDTDLIILSACNTASENDEFEPSTFSGLTQAFFGAGAKSLVVSHWNVVSSAAKDLTSNLVSHLREHKDVSTSAALQSTINDFMTTADDPHPFVWGPFFYVGSTTRVSL
jgi:CHAT domain-containing protein/tetratricopeptide (TPR) repeat protein